MFLLAQRVAARLEPHYSATSATVAIQDGPAAGQTVRAAPAGRGGGGERAWRRCTSRGGLSHGPTCSRNARLAPRPLDTSHPPPSRLLPRPQVPHVHMHIMPRRPGDFEPNDKVYEEVESQERALDGDLKRWVEAWTGPSARVVLAEQRAGCTAGRMRSTLDVFMQAPMARRPCLEHAGARRARAAAAAAAAAAPPAQRGTGGSTWTSSARRGRRTRWRPRRRNCGGCSFWSNGVPPPLD
jgi:hypothetical protein